MGRKGDCKEGKNASGGRKGKKRGPEKWPGGRGFYVRQVNLKKGSFFRVVKSCSWLSESRKSKIWNVKKVKPKKVGQGQMKSNADKKSRNFQTHLDLMKLD